MKILSDKDVLAGLMFAVFGLLGLTMSAPFDFGSTARPGPGFFPIVLSVLLVLIGLGVVAFASVRAEVAAPHIVLRPLVMITLSVAVFALCVERFGLMPAVFLAAMIASFGQSRYGTVTRLWVSAALTLASAVLFIGLLRLPIAPWLF